MFATDEAGQKHREVMNLVIERSKRRKRRRKVGVSQLKDALGAREVAQTVYAQIDKVRVRRQDLRGKLLHGMRDQNLSAMSCRSDARAAIHRRAVIIALASVHLSGMDGDPNP